MARAHRGDVLADGAHHRATASVGRVVGRVRDEFPQMVSFEHRSTEVHVNPRRFPRPQPLDEYRIIKTPVCQQLTFSGTQLGDDGCVFCFCCPVKMDGPVIRAFNNRRRPDDAVSTSRT